MRRVELARVRGRGKSLVESPLQAFDLVLTGLEIVPWAVDTGLAFARYTVSHRDDGLQSTALWSLAKLDEGETRRCMHRTFGGLSKPNHTLIVLL